MTHRCARLIAVAITAVSFSTPLYAQQEPTPPPTLEALVEILGGGLGHENEQGEVVEFLLIGDQVTDASLAHLTGLTALKDLPSLTPRSPMRAWRILRGCLCWRLSFSLALRSPTRVWHTSRSCLH